MKSKRQLISEKNDLIQEEKSPNTYNIHEAFIYQTTQNKDRNSNNDNDIYEIKDLKTSENFKITKKEDISEFPTNKRNDLVTDNKNILRLKAEIYSSIVVVSQKVISPSEQSDISIFSFGWCFNSQ